MAHITLQQLTTVLGRIVSWATTKFVVKDTRTGKLEYADMPVVVLSSMGHELDGTPTDTAMSPGSTYYLPAGGGASARIIFRPLSGSLVTTSPVSTVIYCNAYTGLLYRWDSTTGQMVRVGVEPDRIRKVYVSAGDYSSLDALHSADTSGVYQVIDQTKQITIGILAVSCDSGGPHFVTQWLFSNCSLTGGEHEYSGSVNGTHYMKAKAHIVHRFYCASENDLSDIPLNTWSEWKVYGLTFDEMADILAAKANDNAVVKTVSVNGGTPQSPVNGNVDINVEGTVPHIGSNGNWWIGDTDTGIKAQGPAGTSITDADLEIGNTLNGQGDVLGMSGAMRIKDNVDSLYASLNRLYSKLANMAFWDATDQAAAEPTPLDWGNPKHNVTLALSLTNAVVKYNGVAKANGDSVQVEEGSTLTLTIEPASGYALTGAPTVSVGGNSVTPTDNSNGTYSVAITMGQSDMTLSITATGAAARSVTLNLTGCTKTSGPTSITNGGGGTFVFAADEDYTLPTAAPTVSGATVSSWDSSTGELVIDSVTGDVTITLTATSPWLTAPKDDVTEGGNVVTYGMQQGRSINPTSGYAAPGLTSGNPTVILSPAAYPYDTKVFTSGTSGYNANTNPGKTTNCFFATGGKRYLKIKMEFNSSDQTTGYDYKVAVACYTSSVLNNSQSDTVNSSISGIVGRIQYAVGNVTTVEWKLDLDTFATEKGKQAGDIAYVKLLMCKYQEGSDTALDSRTWIDNMTLKYYFTDD